LASVLLFSLTCPLQDDQSKIEVNEKKTTNRAIVFFIL